MKTIFFLRRFAFLTLISLLSFSCSKDDSLPEPKPQTGYFVKSIIVTETESSDESMKIGFRYDGNNRINEQTVDGHTIRYAYNDLGQLTDYSFDDDESYRFEYKNNIITKILEHDPQTDEVVDEIPIAFSNGTYSVNGEAVCKVGDQGQLLELTAEDVVFKFGDGAGVHRHLKLSPARYLVLELDFTVYDLTLSDREFLGWVQEGGNVSVESQRNEQGLITNMRIVTLYNKEYQWEIEYVERDLSGQ